MSATLSGLTRFDRGITALAIFALAALSAACGPTNNGGEGGAVDVGNVGDAGGSGDAGDSDRSDGSIDVPPPAPVSLAQDPDAREQLASVRDEMLRAGKCSDDCLRELRDLHQAYPTSEDVRIALNNALVQRQDWNGLAMLYEARPTRTAQEEAYLAAVYIKLGRFQEAAAALVPLSDARPADDELAYNAAYALQHMGDHDAAAARLDARWDAFLTAENTHAMTLRALAHTAAGQPEQAIEVLTSVVEIDPDYFPAHYALGQAHAAVGDDAAAEAAFQRVSAIHAATEADTSRRLRLSAQAEALKAAWAEKDYAEAERLVDAMLPQVDEPGLRRTILEFAAAIYDATGRPEEAREALRQAGAVDVAEADQP